MRRTQQMPLLIIKHYQKPQSYLLRRCSYCHLHIIPLPGFPSEVINHFHKIDTLSPISSISSSGHPAGGPDVVFQRDFGPRRLSIAKQPYSQRASQQRKTRNGTKFHFDHTFSASLSSLLFKERQVQMHGSCLQKNIYSIPSRPTLRDLEESQTRGVGSFIDGFILSERKRHS